MDNIYVAHGSETTPQITHNGETFFAIKFTGEGNGCTALAIFNQER